MGICQAVLCKKRRALLTGIIVKTSTSTIFPIQYSISRRQIHGRKNSLVLNQRVVHSARGKLAWGRGDIFVKVRCGGGGILGINGTRMEILFS